MTTLPVVHSLIRTGSPVFRLRCALNRCVNKSEGVLMRVEQILRIEKNDTKRFLPL